MGRKKSSSEEEAEDERPPKEDIDPEEVRLADGSPAYNAVLTDDVYAMPDPHDVQEAKNYLRTLAKENFELVLSLQGMTRDEAKRILGFDSDKAQAA